MFGSGLTTCSSICRVLTLSSLPVFVSFPDNTVSIFKGEQDFTTGDFTSMDGSGNRYVTEPHEDEIDYTQGSIWYDALFFSLLFSLE